MQTFHQRSQQKELMDSEVVDYQEFAQCLAHLEIINIFTFAYRPTLRWFRREITKHSSEELSLLDVGSGGGDMMRRLLKISEKEICSTNFTGVDMNEWAKEYGLKHTDTNAPIKYITSNLFDLDLLKKPDFITNSLFTHHLSDKQLIKFIKWMDLNAQQSWFINDLHRHFVPYYFIKLVTRIFPFHRFVKHDAAVSVARAFTKADWHDILNEAGISNDRYRVKWHFPFRYSVTCKKQ